ncbi:hypothetical protein RHMOL_Rhmol04G0078200 [Rhododendron molle]|uniref:Uncharacterized protein n=1 Tax=Rhododendron molle TaxID=49168 RepID=A0ACC0NY67_RHOML|nr:hypothetical protein RHMOL_Rhmol04G0078200 [Rhododendron molle]
MVLCSGVHSTVLCTSEPSDRTFDGSDLISVMNDSRSLVAEMRSEKGSTVLWTTRQPEVPRYMGLSSPIS